MSQAMSLDGVASFENGAGAFEYRPIPFLVPLSWAFVVLSVGAFMWEPLTLIPLVGAILAVIAWRKIRRQASEYSGQMGAAAAFVAAMSLFASSFGMHAYAYTVEVPEGFRRVSFAREISSRPLAIVDGQPQIDPEVQKLDDQPVFLKGYMYPTRQTHHLQQFLLCKDSGDCCFGGQPKPTDMILVEMPIDRLVNFRSGLVSVAGRFHTSPSTSDNEQKPVYWMEGEIFSGAKTSY